MSKTISIAVHHLTRVEGHGNIAVNVTNGKIEKCEWQVPEAPRFFEAMVRGRHYSVMSTLDWRVAAEATAGAEGTAAEAGLGAGVGEDGVGTPGTASVIDQPLRERSPASREWQPRERLPPRVILLSVAKRRAFEAVTCGECYSFSPHACAFSPMARARALSLQGSHGGFRRLIPSHP